MLILLGAPLLLKRGTAATEVALLRRRLLVLGAAGLAVPLLSGFAFGSAAMRSRSTSSPFPALILWLLLGRSVPPAVRGGARGAGVLAFGWFLHSIWGSGPTTSVVGTNGTILRR